MSESMARKSDSEQPQTSAAEKAGKNAAEQPQTSAAEETRKNAAEQPQTSAAEIAGNNTAKQPKKRRQSKKKRKKQPMNGFKLSCVLFFLIGIALTLYTLYTVYTVKTFAVDIYPKQYKVGDEFSVSVDDGKGSWKNPDFSARERYGSEYDIVIEFKGKNALRNWVLSYEVQEPSYIDSSWNGVYSKQNGVITVLPMDYNYEVASGETIEIGFVMYSPKKLELDHFRLEGERVIKPYRQPPFWIMVVAMFTLLVIAITNLFANVKLKHMQEKISAQKTVTDQALRTFAKIIDAKDEYTSGHSYRVAVYSREIATRMGLDADDCERIYYMALLHDIGKIGVPDNILTKNSRLDDDEWTQIQTHVTIGADILAEFSAIPGISDGAKYHHERYDGNGYCFGISGEEIPLFARIISVADSYDAMSSARVYRPAIAQEKIMNELEVNKGKQFDPDIAQIMLEMIMDGTAPVNL